MKTQTVKTEIFQIQGASVKVEYSVKKENGSVSELEIYSVNDVPDTFIEGWVLDSIDMSIRDHEYKDNEFELEFKAEAKGDELRGR